jgi:hypothetical protein
MEERVLHHVSLKISPKLTFSQIEVGLGERDHDYAVLEPSISAAGRGGSDLSWDYYAARDSSITGGKRMHALLRAPASVTRMTARISASADVLVDRRFRWPARLPKNEPARVVVLYTAASKPD